MMKPRVTREPPRDAAAAASRPPPGRRGGGAGRGGRRAGGRGRASRGRRHGGAGLEPDAPLAAVAPPAAVAGGGPPGDTTADPADPPLVWAGTGSASEIGISLVAELRAGAPTPAGAAGIPVAAAAGRVAARAATGAPAAAAAAASAGAGAGATAGRAIPGGAGAGAGVIVPEPTPLRLSWATRSSSCCTMLGRFVGPVAQRGRLACLGEIQQDENRQANDGGESGVGTHRGDEVVHREGKWDGCHDVSAQFKGRYRRLSLQIWLRGRRRAQRRVSLGRQRHLLARAD